MNPIQNNNRYIPNSDERPAGLSDNAWGTVQNKGLLREGNGSIWDTKPEYGGFLNLFSPADLQIVLTNWGKKFQDITLDGYQNLPPLDFSQCTHATGISLSNLTHLPAMAGNLADRGRLASITVENVRSVAPRALDALLPPTTNDLTIWCKNSGLFRIGGQQAEAIEAIDLNEIAEFLNQHPDYRIYGLIPDNTIPQQDFLNSLAQHGIGLDLSFSTPAIVKA